jgi:Family of unknown function (DUF6082)
LHESLARKSVIIVTSEAIIKEGSVVNRTRLRNLVTSPKYSIGLTALAIMALALVIFSPIALEQLEHISGINWATLSNIGQTYGAISALVSALALGGVAVSLIFQARDLRYSSEVAARTFHYDLLKLQMGDPFYMEILAAPGLGAGLTDYDSLRTHTYVHMWVSYWEGRYKVHELSDSELRYLAANELFTSAGGRHYWATTRDFKLKYYIGRLSRFTHIVDEQYKKAIEAGPPANIILKKKPGSRTSDDSSQIVSKRSIIAICAGTGAGAVAGYLLRRCLHVRSS